MTRMRRGRRRGGRRAPSRRVRVGCELVGLGVCGFVVTCDRVYILDL